MCFFFLDRSSRGIFLFLELNSRCGRGQLTVGSATGLSNRGVGFPLFWETALRLRMELIDGVEVAYELRKRVKKPGREFLCTMLGSGMLRTDEA